MPGATSDQIRPHYESLWSGWAPEWVVVDLSHNDKDVDRFEHELDRIAGFNTAHGIRTLFILEPNTIENRKTLAALEARHAAMRRIASAHGIPVLPMHARLVARRDEGFLWWDRVHLTDFGQRRFADELVPELGRQLGVRCGAEAVLDSTLIDEATPSGP